MTPVLTVADTLAFVESHGIVLVSAKGPAPRLIDAVAGEEIKGNWWSHPKAKAIYSVLSEVSDSDTVLVCRLINGKLTLVHRRLWPALVRVAGGFDAKQVAQVREQHTASGKHVTNELAFPGWVPAEVAEQAKALGEEEALELLGTQVT